jgi:hypothetical protein
MARSRTLTRDTQLVCANCGKLFFYYGWNSTKKYCDKCAKISNRGLIPKRNIITKVV